MTYKGGKCQGTPGPKCPGSCRLVNCISYDFLLNVLLRTSQDEGDPRGARAESWLKEPVAGTRGTSSTGQSKTGPVPVAVLSDVGVPRRLLTTYWLRAHGVGKALTCLNFQVKPPTLYHGHLPCSVLSATPTGRGKLCLLVAVLRAWGQGAVRMKVTGQWIWAQGNNVTGIGSE